MADQLPQPIDLKQLKARLGKQRRWYLGLASHLASIESHAIHQIDELMQLEKRLDATIAANAPAPPSES